MFDASQECMTRSIYDESLLPKTCGKVQNAQFFFRRNSIFKCRLISDYVLTRRNQTQNISFYCSRPAQYGQIIDRVRFSTNPFISITAEPANFISCRCATSRLKLLVTELALLSSSRMKWKSFFYCIQFPLSQSNENIRRWEWISCDFSILQPDRGCFSFIADFNCAYVTRTLSSRKS